MGVELGAAGEMGAEGSRMSRQGTCDSVAGKAATKLPRPTWPVIRPSDSSNS